MPDRGIGKGLEALLADRRSEGSSELRTVPIELIEANPNQPRSGMGEEELAALAGSIAECGVVQPVVVRELADGSYQLIAGERRWQAARRAGLTELPAILRHDIDADRGSSLELALVENVVREDLNPIDEARACAQLVDDLGLTKEEVGRRIGRSRSAISNLVRLLELPDQVQKLLQSRALSEGHGRAILQSADHRQRIVLARKVVSRHLTVRETERLARGDGQISTSDRYKAKVELHPDLEQLVRRIEAELGARAGVPVKVCIDNGRAKIELRVDDLSTLAAVARRLQDNCVAA